MKTLKTKIAWYSLFAIVGAVLFVVNFVSGGNNSYVTGFAAAMVAVALVKIFRLIRIPKSTQLLKKFEIEQKEERLIMLAEKSGRYTFLITVLLELVAAIVLMFLQKDDFAAALATVAGLQAFVYVALYYWLSKKL